MNRRSATVYAVSLAVLLMAAIFVGSTSTAVGSLAGVKICIDPGHGGTDPGAVNGDLWESEINLDVSYGLKALLEADGAAVAMTRYDDSYLTNRDRYTFCNSQFATILVSVHTNSTIDPENDGTMVLYFERGPEESDDRVLAQAIYNEMYPYLRDSAPVPGEDFVGYGVVRFASGVLMKSDMPAAMIEPLFMSNPDEAALLEQPIYDDPSSGSFYPGCQDFDCRRGQIALATHLGILSYFEGVDPTPTPEPDGIMHVSAVGMGYQQRGPQYSVYTEVSIEDSNGGPVPGARVSVNTLQPDGSIVHDSELTRDDGKATLKLRSVLTGIYRSTVTTVGKEGWLYDAAANGETEDWISVP